MSIKLKRVIWHLKNAHEKLIAVYGWDAWEMSVDILDERLYGLPHPKKKKKVGEPDWTRGCDNCGASPIVPETGLCGPCNFGEADTAGGNW